MDAFKPWSFSSIVHFTSEPTSFLQESRSFSHKMISQNNVGLDYGGVNSWDPGFPIAAQILRCSCLTREAVARKIHSGNILLELHSPLGHLLWVQLFLKGRLDHSEVPARRPDNKTISVVSVAGNKTLERKLLD